MQQQQRCADDFHSLNLRVASIERDLEQIKAAFPRDDVGAVDYRGHRGYHAHKIAEGQAMGLMAGREHAQAEYKYLQTAGLKRAAVKFLELRVLVTKSAWSKDSILDFVIPTVVATSTYLLLTLL